jgi:hypothetical protein
MTTRGETLTIRSSEHCPKTGWWQPLQSEDRDQTAPSRFVGQGCVMPNVNGASTWWVQSGNARLQTVY